MWRTQNIKRQGPGKKAIATGKLGEAKLRAEIKKLEAEADAKALRLQQLRGELVERAEVVREFAEFLLAARPILDGLPDDIAKETPLELQTRMRGIAKHAVDRVMTKISQWEPSGEHDDSSGGGTDLAAADEDAGDSLGD